MVAAVAVLGLAFLSASIGAIGPRRRTAVSSASLSFQPLVLVLLFVVSTALFTVVDAFTIVTGVIVVLTLSWYLRNTREIANTAKRADLLASFLGLCAGNLRAGVTMVEAMDYALANTALPNSSDSVELRHTLQTAARQARSGGSGPKVLIDDTSPDVQRLGHLWQTSAQHGIPLVSLIEQMRLRISAKQRHRESTRAALQGPQATAIILTVLPIAGVVMGTAMGANPIGVLTGGGIGGILLVVGVGLDALGFIVTHKILKSASPS